MRAAGWLGALVAATLAVSATGSGLATGRVGLAREAAAQPYRDGDSATERRGPPDARREQIKKKIRALRAYTLTEELELDEQTATRLFPVLSRYDDDFDRLLEQRVEIHRRLRRAAARDGARAGARDGSHDTRAIDRLIDEAAANQRAFWDLQDKRLVTLRKILTPSQTAKLLVVLPSLERRIENQLRKAIQRRPGTSGDPGTAVEDDDDPQPDAVTPPPQRPRRREGPLPPRPPRSSAPGNTPPCDPSLGPCR
jgi:hypothetical protein